MKTDRKNPSKIHLLDLITLDELQSLQDSFAIANDVSSSISDLNGNLITSQSNSNRVCQIIRSTETGRINCVHSDRELGNLAALSMKPTVRKCLSCGFIEASAPIIVGGLHIANWQISHNTLGVDEKRITEYAKEIGADRESMLNAFKKGSRISLKKFHQILDLLWKMASEISSRSYSNMMLHKELDCRKKSEDLVRSQRDSLRDMASRLALAEEATRRKIAISLHDSVGHELVALKRHLRSTLRNNNSSDDIEVCLELVESVIRTTRDLTFQLSPPLLYDLGLSAAIDSLAEDLFKKRGISFSLTDKAPDYKTPVAVRVQVYQMTRELFYNILKHAFPSKVDVFIDVKNNTFTLEVKDDGVGMKILPRSSGKGLGLLSIRERLKHYGGAVNFKSQPNMGTSVKLVIPVGDEAIIERELLD